MEFELGQTYSGYQFLDVVRRSPGTVQYRVQNTLAQRVESLRTLSGAAADDPSAAERFLREVRIRARISHPHIVTFYTAVPIEGRMAMTTELPDSLSLAERLKLGPLPWREALDITSQLLDALDCIHQQSFVHCDITPENILFGPGGYCKLGDFSLARPLDPAHSPQSGAVVGNPRYISPEQVKGERHLDQRSDLYSLGVVLYEMLCGRPPFESRSQFELMMAHVNQAPAPPSHLHAKVPQFLDAVVLKSLAKDAADRYPSAAAFADAVAHAAGNESAEPEPPAAVVAAVVRSEPAPLPQQPAPAPAMAEAAVPQALAIPAPEASPVDPPTSAIVPELEAAPEPAPAIAEAAVPEALAIPAPAASPVAPPTSATELETAPEPAPAIAEAAVPAALAIPAPEASPFAPPPSATVPELEAAPESAPAIAEAAALTDAVTVPAPEAFPVAAPATARAIVHEASVSTESVPAMAQAAAPEAVTVPAPEAVPEAAALRSREEIAGIAMLTDESVCPTLGPKSLRSCGAGAFACQPVFSHLLIAEAVAPPASAIVPELAAAPESAPAIAEAAALPDAVTVPATEASPFAPPTSAIVPELSVSPQPVPVFAEAAALPDAVTVPATETVLEAAAEVAAAPVPAMAEAAAVPETVTVPAPEAPLEAAALIAEAVAAPASAIVPELSVSPQPAPAIPEAVAEPQPTSSSETGPPPSPQAALPARDAAVIAAAPQPATAVVPPD